MTRQTLSSLIAAGIFVAFALSFALRWNDFGLWFTLACAALVLLTLIPARQRRD